MNLYIWEGAGVLEDCGSGLIVAIANDLDEAKSLADEETFTYIDDEGNPKRNYPNTPTEVIYAGGMTNSPLNPGIWVCWGSS